MEKIKTIFERDWDGDRKVVDKLIVNFDFECASATEKLDGTNVRLTVRNHKCVRLEKRRNPSKLQKAGGIVEPWYVDADEYGPEDKWIFDALKNTNLTFVEDGEWPGEAVGKNIQGNPLNLNINTIVLFSCGWAPVFSDVPHTYQELKEWLPKQKSKIGKDCGIEGIVWHGSNGTMVKIKQKDFPK